MEHQSLLSSCQPVSCRLTEPIFFLRTLGVTAVLVLLGGAAFPEAPQQAAESLAFPALYAGLNVQDARPNVMFYETESSVREIKEHTAASVDAEVPAKPAVHTTHDGSRFALAFKTSTLGLGADVGVRLASPINLRLGVSGFNYTRTVPDGDLAYLGALRLRSVQALVDWFPWNRGFHISPGLLAFNGNRVTAHALIPTGKVLSSGTEVFVSNPKNPITGSAKSALRQVAPMVLFGFGNLVPRTRRFSVSADVGVVFQGTPTTSFALIGSACDVSGAHCQDVKHSPSIQADVQAGEKTMQDDLSFMRFYPVVSVEFGYRF